MRKNYISSYPVITFFILTFLISWGAIWLIFGTDGIPATKELQQKIGMVILLGPSIASLLLIWAFYGRKGFRQLATRLVQWRVHIKWYALALLLAPISTLIGIAIWSLFIAGYPPAIYISDNPSELLTLGIIGGLTIGLFEEVGWTGFATPHLTEKHNIYHTGILIGVLWGAWHFILFWENDSFTMLIPFLLLLARLFAWLPAYRILMVWVYKSTQSLLILILMHASLVASLVTLDPNVVGIDLLIYILIRAIVLWAIVAIVAIIGTKQKKYE